MIFEKLPLPSKGEKHTWGNLQGSALPLAIAQAVQQSPRGCLIITPDQVTANRLQALLATLLADNSSPHPTSRGLTAGSSDVEKSLDPAVKPRDVGVVSEVMKCQQPLIFPDWETLPYDRFSPYQELISQRLLTLNRLLSGQKFLVISTAATLMHRLCPKSYLLEHVWSLSLGQSIDRMRLRVLLEEAGYLETSQVLAHGEFAVRGSLLDVYPMGSALPFRIDLFDDVIESIRTFDPQTQRTLERLPALKLLPAHEFSLNADGVARFRRQYREKFPNQLLQSVVYEAVSAGQLVGGVEYYLPLFFEKTATFFDYLDPQTLVIQVGDLSEEGTRFEKGVTARYHAYRHDRTWPLLPPEDLFLVQDAFQQQIAAFSCIQLTPAAGTSQFHTAKGPALYLQRQKVTPLADLIHYVKEKSDWKILFTVESIGRREILLELLRNAAIHPVVVASWEDFCAGKAALAMLVAPFDEGVEWPLLKIALITERQLFGEAAVPQCQSSGKVVDPDKVIRDLVELQIHAPVVHVEHGVGRYNGLKTLTIQGIEQEFIELLYAEGDKVYVPVTALSCVTRYSGTSPEQAPLHRLGSDVWQREKKKAAEAIHDVAVELLEIYAHRQCKPGIVMQVVEPDYTTFVSEFPFVSTNDQVTAAEAVLKDLQSATPMDRLICGDVGFGKTEVAMRAAFVAVQNGKQVCVLVPTTLLASQHEQTFRDRFANFPIQIGLLSRFKNAKDSAKVIAGAEKGTVDILIGTHKLLLHPLSFKALGLLIIDEEHRFGVKQKETLKALKQEVHCLTMTATPIPRTLNMAMSGLRDISLIATPPARRLAIKTFWREKSALLIREAVLREISRGGQVFYLHNDVASIARVTEELIQLLPETSVQLAHGQMPERALERIMSDFYHQRFHVLVCTTIIETGIDIPTANTMIIDRADLLGLAQLHQLRGRVGRSHHQAYAYLLTPPEKSLSADAVKRLEAIVSLEALGSGFILASHDLEIRGAGALLGDAQSGNIHAIGFTLYRELLDRAVQSLKEGKTPQLYAPNRAASEMEVYFSALFPSSYIEDPHMRLILYKRLAGAATEAELEALQGECIDRFGLLPVATRYLFQITQLTLSAKGLGIERLRLLKGEAHFYFGEQPRINTAQLIQWLQQEPLHYRMQGPTCLRVTGLSEAPEASMQAVKEVLKQLTSGVGLAHGNCIL